MTATTRHDRAVAAEQLLGVLYPSPLTVASGDADGAGVRRSWTAIPSAQRPRLLVPATGGRAAARVVRRQLTGHRLRTRVARGVVSGAMATGILPRLAATRLVVAGPADAPCIEDVLSRALGEQEVRLALPVGPARANRKPVLQVVDTRGQVLAFAKVGHNELTAGLVRREAQVLDQLSAAVTAGVRVPRLIAATDWSGHEVLVQEALSVPRRRLGGTDADGRLVRVVADIARLAGPVQRVPWAEHPLQARLRARIDDAGTHRGALEGALSRIRFTEPVATGAWHGDLNSGNLALVAGPCPVWDWERFETGVPLGFDLLHHRLHEEITVAGAPAHEAAPRLVRGARGLLAPLGVPGADADAVARLYLVTLATRYLADDQAGAGAALGAVETWLLPAVATSGPRRGAS